MTRASFRYQGTDKFRERTGFCEFWVCLKNSAPWTKSPKIDNQIKSILESYLNHLNVTFWEYARFTATIWSFAPTFTKSAWCHGHYFALVNAQLFGIFLCYKIVKDSCLKRHLLAFRVKKYWLQLITYFCLFDHFLSGNSETDNVDSFWWVDCSQFERCKQK